MHDEPRDPDAPVPGQQGDPGDLTERHPTIPADQNATVIDDRPAAATPAAPDPAQPGLDGPTWPSAAPVEPYGTPPAASYTPSPEPRADWARSWSESTPVTPERWYEPAPATPSTVARRDTEALRRPRSARWSSHPCCRPCSRRSAPSRPCPRWVCSIVRHPRRRARRRRRASGPSSRSPSTNRRRRSPWPPRSARPSSASPSPGRRTRATTG